MPALPRRALACLAHVEQIARDRNETRASVADRHLWAFRLFGRLDVCVGADFHAKSETAFHHPRIEPSRTLGAKQ